MDMSVTEIGLTLRLIPQNLLLFTGDRRCFTFDLMYKSLFLRTVLSVCVCVFIQGSYSTFFVSFQTIDQPCALTVYSLFLTEGEPHDYSQERSAFHHLLVHQCVTDSGVVFHGRGLDVMCLRSRVQSNVSQGIPDSTVLFFNCCTTGPFHHYRPSHSLPVLIVGPDAGNLSAIKIRPNGALRQEKGPRVQLQHCRSYRSHCLKQENLCKHHQLFTDPALQKRNQKEASSLLENHSFWKKIFWCDGV